MLPASRLARKAAGNEIFELESTLLAGDGASSRARAEVERL